MTMLASAPGATSVKWPPRTNEVRHTPSFLHSQPAMRFSGGQPADAFSARVPADLGASTLWMLQKLFLYQILIPKNIQGMTQPQSLEKTLPYLINIKSVLPNIQPTAFKTDDGVALQGYWSPAPAKQDASPEYAANQKKTMVLVHGTLNNAGCMASLAKVLNGEGYNVFMYDSRGCGKSGGKSTLGFKEGQDIYAAVTHIKKKHPQQSQRLGILGQSMGAAAVLMMPESLSEDKRKVLHEAVNLHIIDAPFNTTKLNEKSVSREGLNPFLKRLIWDEDAHKPSDKKLLNTMKWVFNEDRRKVAVALLLQQLNSPETQKMLGLPKPFRDYNTSEAWLKDPVLSQKPMLHLHGRKDLRTAFDQAQAIQSKLGAALPAYTMVPLEGDHLNYAAPDPEGTAQPKSEVMRDAQYAEIVLQYLKEHL